MKFSLNWLKQWVRLEIDAATLAEKLTAAGLEVESVEPVAADFTEVVIAEITSFVRHPNAERLTVCSVNDGSAEALQIVCGAPNVRAGMRVPLARVGASLGAGPEIRAAELRGVRSAGMLCSARELGLSQDHSGLLELPEDAPLGASLRTWMALDDYTIEVDLTPNRADCLSIRGIARDVSAMCAAEYLEKPIMPVHPVNEARMPIRLDMAEDCPRYVGRIIKGINPAAKTPLWMAEALRRCDVRSISPVVDVTNYVLLELGQPMHAFDLDSLDQEIIVRRGRAGEQLKLLDGTEVAVDENVLAICDRSGPVALAGIMGGLVSSVQAHTTNILFESAWFKPSTIMGKARDFGLHTDASHRFERGVDPQGQVRAIEYATALLLEICGGSPGPVLHAEEPRWLPVNPTVTLRHERLKRLTGLDLTTQQVGAILSRLGMAADFEAGTWTLMAPSARMDIAIEEDLIEEVARIHGYDLIPEAPPSGIVSVGNAASHDVPLAHMQQSLCGAGYQEVINYSFVDLRSLQALHQDTAALALANPLAADMNVMRTTLLPGLLTALNYNLRRQQDRVRLFETGLAYLQQGDEYREIQRIAGVCTGTAWPEQWSSPKRPVDFFDVKGDVERLAALGGGAGATLRPFKSAWTHPGASAEITVRGEVIGWCGALHPSVLQSLDVEGEVYAFEMDLRVLQIREVPFVSLISRFPSIRRDLAVWVPEHVSFAEVSRVIRDAAGALLQNLVVFDVYHDKKLKKGYKSLAIGLILQNVSSTLTDEVVDPVIRQTVAQLERRLGAQLRG